MPRQIFVEEQSEETTMDENSSKEEITLNDGVIISSDEMEKLFNEWDVDGKNDLCINASLAERIRQYLKYQEELDPLKKDLAKRIYAPFKMYGQGSNLTKIYVNSRYIGEAELYKANDIYRVIKIKDFKNILIALENPYAPWIDEDGGIDLEGYILSIGGTYDFNYSISKLDIRV